MENEKNKCNVILSAVKWSEAKRNEVEEPSKLRRMFRLRFAALNMTMLFVLLFFSIFIFPLAFSQDTIAITPIITEHELLRYSSFDLKTKKDIIAISPQRQMITREGNDFYISSIDIPTDKTSLLPITGKPHFSFDGNYIVFLSNNITWDKRIDGAKGRQEEKFLVVYDVRFRKTTKIPNTEGAIIRGDVSSRSEFILYQMNQVGELPKVYLAEPNGKHSRFISDGLLGEWSPNGDWFTILKPKLYGDWEMQSERKRENVISKFSERRKPNSFDLTWTAWIYNSFGDPIFELANYDAPRFISWSPNSDKIILRSYNDDDFHILKIKDAAFSGVEEVGKFGYESRREEETHDPIWSFDGKKILFVKSFWNYENTRCLKNETWICNSDGSKSFKLSETDERTTEYPLWTKDGTILLLREKLNYSDEVELYVVEQTIQ